MRSEGFTVRGRVSSVVESTAGCRGDVVDFDQRRTAWLEMLSRQERRTEVLVPC